MDTAPGSDAETAPGGHTETAPGGNGILEITPLLPKHWPRVRAIYLEGILTGNATFATEAPGWAKWDGDHLPECRFVAQLGEELAGWSALSPVSGRCVYAGVAEVSVYVAEDARGRGVGTQLLDALVHNSESHGIWTLQAGIFPENQASLAIHAAAGFRVVGVRERLGQRDGVWRDVVLLERRSRVVGVE